MPRVWHFVNTNDGKEIKTDADYTDMSKYLFCQESVLRRIKYSCFTNSTHHVLWGNEKKIEYFTFDGSLIGVHTPSCLKLIDYVHEEEDRFHDCKRSKVDRRRICFTNFPEMKHT